LTPLIPINPPLVTVVHPSGQVPPSPHHSPRNAWGISTLSCAPAGVQAVSVSNAARIAFITCADPRATRGMALCFIFRLRYRSIRRRHRLITCAAEEHLEDGTLRSASYAGLPRAPLLFGRGHCHRFRRVRLDPLESFARINRGISYFPSCAAR